MGLLWSAVVAAVVVTGCVQVASADTGSHIGLGVGSFSNDWSVQPAVLSTTASAGWWLPKVGGNSRIAAFFPAPDDLVDGPTVVDIYVHQPFASQCVVLTIILVNVTGAFDELERLSAQQFCLSGPPVKKLTWVPTVELTAALAGEPMQLSVMRLPDDVGDTLTQDFKIIGARIGYLSDLETEGMEGKMTEVQGAELLDGLQALVYFAGIGIAVVTASLLAGLLSFFRR